jgi:hypothetical protein
MFLEKKIYEEKKKIPHAHYQTATPKLKIWRKVESKFLVFGLQISKPIVEGWEQIVYFLLPSINFKAQSKELHAWLKKRN